MPWFLHLSSWGLVVETRRDEMPEQELQQGVPVGQSWVPGKTHLPAVLNYPTFKKSLFFRLRK